METTAFDITSSLSLKEGAILRGKAPAVSPAQEFQPEGNSLFADMLEQKIAEGTSGSAPGIPTASQSKKRPVPIAVKGINIARKAEPAMDGKAKPKTDPPGSPAGEEPIGSAATEGAPLAGPAKTISSPLTAGREPAGAAKITVAVAAENPLSEKKVAPAARVTASDEHDSEADPVMAESNARPIVQPPATDTGLFAQPLQLPEAGTLEEAAVMPLTETHSGMKTEPPAAIGVLREEPSATVSAEPLPASGHHTDHRSALKGSENTAEPQPPFVPDAVEAEAGEKGKASADAASDLPGKGSGVEVGAGLERRQTAATAHSDGKPSGEPKGGAAAAIEKPSPTVHDVEPVPERTTPAGSANRSLPSGSSATESTAAVRDHQQVQGTTVQHPAKHAERDPIPFHVDLTNATSLQQDVGTAAPAAPSAAEMQGVIDQILAARQTVSSDSGRIRILLNPPNLGSVDLEIVVRGERVEVVMTAENASVQQALQSRGDDIRISLQRQDLKIEGFQVLLQDNGAGQQQARGDAMYGEGGERRERYTREDSAPALPAFSSPIMGRTSVEGRVSIFA
ncbi:MAG: flagellar hook-length control protein FliK [Deltaproteobacteria bacterium]|nr:flagellar hook-length control protein FliK [Deltaproteobacteria bacterium]